jgi:hypothetical protein
MLRQCYLPKQRYNWEGKSDNRTYDVMRHHVMILSVNVSCSSLGPSVISPQKCTWSEEYPQDAHSQGKSPDAPGVVFQKYQCHSDGFPPRAFLNRHSIPTWRYIIYFNWHSADGVHIMLTVDFEHPSVHLNERPSEGAVKTRWLVICQCYCRG